MHLDGTAAATTATAATARAAQATAAQATVAQAITLQAVTAVETLIRPHVRLTPALTIDRAELGVTAGPLTLKLEQLQHTGSFKARGAFANLLLRPVPEAGVAAASGGNHGAAVAFAAHQLGVPAQIFVPQVSSPAKTERIRSYGADLVVTGATYSDSLAACQQAVARTGAMPVHAFDQAETILGAGTTGLELIGQAPGMNTVLAGIGGGGLLSGIVAASDGRVRIVGVEPDGAPTLTLALKAGQPVDAPTGSVAVDSLAPRQVGHLVYQILSQAMHSVVLVSDDDILQAQAMLWQRLRIVAEPGGCAALAALLSGSYVPQPGEHVAVVISGANTAAVVMPGPAGAHGPR